MGRGAMPKVIFVLTVFIALIVSSSLVWFGLQQPVENRVDWFGFAFVISATVVTIIIGLYKAPGTLRAAPKPPKVEIGLVHYDDKTSHLPVDTRQLTDQDSARPHSHNAITRLVIKNTGKIAAHNIRLHITHESENQATKPYYGLSSANLPIKKIAQGRGITTFKGEKWYLGAGDAQIITISLERSGPGRPVGQHSFTCEFWADGLSEPIKKTLRLTVHEPE